VLCAGFAIPRGTEETTVGDLRELWQLHVVAPFLMIKAALPYLRKSRDNYLPRDSHQHDQSDTMSTDQELHDSSTESADDNSKSTPPSAATSTRTVTSQFTGHITFISSLMGFYPMTMNLAYGVTKAAQDHFTRLLSRELQPSPGSTAAGRRGDGAVRVNSVRPGWIRTPIIENAGVIGGKYTAEAVFKIFGLMTPLKRCGSAEEVGEYVALLANHDACQHINGQNLLIDGGEAVSHKPVAPCNII
jgi:NAD(P)-dependent dehydrogenase (short-subunit alcohol dehydrogenase family)